MAVVVRKAVQVLHLVRYWIALAVVLPWAVLFVGAALRPMPAEVYASVERARQQGAGGAGAVASDSSTVFWDRQRLGAWEARADDGQRADWVAIEQVPDRVKAAVLAAEDKRFASHFGVDPIATSRAAMQALSHGQVVSGASTLTQQLARNLTDSPRTLGAKIDVMWMAVRIERELDKDTILELYLNEISFGRGIRGVRAASRHFFDKDLDELSAAEAATLAGIPRGPGIYDPHRSPARLLRRRDRVLHRMAEAGWLEPDALTRALGEPLTPRPANGRLGAYHFTQALVQRRLPGAEALDEAPQEVITTLDRDLQKEATVLTQKTVEAFADREVSAAAALIVDNETGDILAYVGSPGLDDQWVEGHNDGVLALRQPGSSLKPFLYELAFEQLGFGAQTLVPDVEMSFAVAEGEYTPQNYDGRYHGPVRLRDALANSYNIPAVWTAQSVSPGAIVRRLRELGFASLSKAPSHYGIAIALGDGEVRLMDLVNAYAVLARGGLFQPLRSVRSTIRGDGTQTESGRSAAKRVLKADEVALLIDILSDPVARARSFGRQSDLEFPFDVAAKTGTSKGFRDNITVGFTPRITVGVWVGNFDGSPMQGVSGVTGAGSLFHRLMLAANERYPAKNGFDRSALVGGAICPLSGKRAGAHCPHRVDEVFVGRQSDAVCDMHVVRPIDPQNGLLAGPGCRDREERVFESFPVLFMDWARSTTRPLVPEEVSARCPNVESKYLNSGRRLTVVQPVDGAQFLLDPGASAEQAIVMRADVPSGAKGVTFVIDGVPHQVVGPRLTWRLVRGRHQMYVAAENGLRSETVSFSVD